MGATESRLWALVSHQFNERLAQGSRGGTPLRGERTAGGAYLPRASARCARTPRGSRVECPARVLAEYGQRGGEGTPATAGSFSPPRGARSTGLAAPPHPPPPPDSAPPRTGEHVHCHPRRFA